MSRQPLPLLDCITDFGRGLVKRKCGSCDVCCRVMAVFSLGKPPNCRCEHQNGEGCAVYSDRPEDCRDYECVWKTGFLNEEDRPDKSGILMSVNEDPENEGRLLLEVYETWPNALTARFPNFGDFVRLIPSVDPVGGIWTIVVVPYGTPRIMKDSVSETYSWTNCLVGHNVAFGNIRVQMAVGATDSQGNLHTKEDGVIPASEAKAYINRLRTEYEATLPVSDTKT